MKHPEQPQEIVVWFSCGAASAVAAKFTIDLYGPKHNVRVVNNPVAEEDADNRRFLRDVETWIGCPIEIATAAKWPGASAREVWAKQRYMAGIDGAPCTQQIKKAARQEWEARNPPVDWHVFGFTAEERQRHKRFVQTERSNVLPVLIDAGVTKRACFKYLQREGLALPRKYAEGYPNGNCIGCVKASSPAYWNLVRRQDPAVFADRAQQSRELGVRLVRVPDGPGRRKRIFLDELSPSAKGGKLKGLDVECGVFCEERPHA